VPSWSIPAGRDEVYPGDDATDQFADQSCRTAFAPYVGRSYERSELFIFYFAPVEETWRLGDREVVCAAQLDGEQLEGSIKGSDR
jgi:hypothetical protein